MQTRRRKQIKAVLRRGLILSEPLQSELQMREIAISIKINRRMICPSLSQVIEPLSDPGQASPSAINHTDQSMSPKLNYLSLLLPQSPLLLVEQVWSSVVDKLNDCRIRTRTDASAFQRTCFNTRRKIGCSLDLYFCFLVLFLALSWFHYSLTLEYLLSKIQKCI